MNDQKASAPLKVAVRIMARGEAITTIKILVNGAFVCPGADTFMSNKDLVPFLDRLNPDEIQYDGSLTSYESDPLQEQIESDLAALRQSRPDVPKINEELWFALTLILDDFRKHCKLSDEEEAPLVKMGLGFESLPSVNRAKAAIRNAKEAQ